MEQVLPKLDRAAARPAVDKRMTADAEELTPR